MGGRLAFKNSVLRWGLGFPSANLFTHWSWCWWRVDWWFSALLRLRCPCPRPRRVVVGGGVVVVDVVVVVVVVVLSRICFPLRWRSAGCATVDLSVRGCAHFNIQENFLVKFLQHTVVVAFNDRRRRLGCENCFGIRAVELLECFHRAANSLRWRKTFTLAKK